jgi:hypothetical protein
VVAVPVDVDAVPPLRLVGLDGVVVGLPGHDRPGNALGQRRHLVERLGAGDRRHDVEAP